MTDSRRIHVGVGGWTFAPWRGDFFPQGLPQKQELQFASTRLTAIEINATYYRGQQPSSFAKWRAETPHDFVFTVKASRYATTRHVLGGAGEAIDRFIGSGLSQLREKLGPIVWQFMPTKRFDAEDLEAFLKLLPRSVDGLELRHALDARHESFKSEQYLELARRHHVATVFADTDQHPSFADLTAEFVYARLMRCQPGVSTGYSPADLDRWASRAVEWAAGHDPEDLPRLGKPAPTGPGRDVFVFFISGAKERAPHAAMALLERIGR